MFHILCFLLRSTIFVKVSLSIKEVERVTWLSFTKACVFISTLVVCSWEQGRSSVHYYLITTSAGQHAQRKNKGHVACQATEKYSGFLAFRLPVGNPFKRKLWWYRSFGDIPLIPKSSDHRIWINSPFIKQNLNTDAFNGNSYLICLIHTWKPILE